MQGSVGLPTWDKTMPNNPTVKSLSGDFAELKNSVAAIANAVSQLTAAFTEPAKSETKVTQTKGKQAKSERPNDIKQAAYWDGKTFKVIPYVKGKGPKSSKVLIKKHKDTEKGGVCMTRVNGHTFMAKRTNGDKTLMTKAMEAALTS